MRHALPKPIRLRASANHKKLPILTVSQSAEERIAALNRTQNAHLLHVNSAFSPDFALHCIP